MLRGPQETPLLRFLGCNLAQRFSAGKASENLSSPVGAMQGFSRTLFTEPCIISVLIGVEARAFRRGDQGPNAMRLY